MTFEEIQLKAFDLTEKESAALQRQMVKEYDIALKAINKEIEKVYAKILSGIEPEEYFNVMTKYNRLFNLQQTISELYAKAARKAKKIVVNNSELAINNVYYRQLYAINWTQTSNVFVALHPAVVEASVFSTSKIWDELAAATRARLTDIFGNPTNYYPQSGTLLNELLKKKNAETLANLEFALRQGLIQGTSYRKIANSVRDVMGTDINKALRIATTESHRNMTTGNYAMMEAAKSQGIEAKRKIVSTMDMRTRPQSRQVDGQIEDDSGFFTYPGGVKVKIPGNSGVARWDINDRESVVTIVDGFDSDVRRARNPVTGETDIISNTSYKQWMKDNNIKVDKNGKMYYDG